MPGTTIFGMEEETPETTANGSRRRSLWIATTLLLLAVATGLYLTRDFWMPVIDRPETVSLRALDHEGQLVVDWSRKAPAVLRASEGILVVEDGGNENKIRLDRPQLQNGSLTFARSSGDVTIRLRLLSTDGGAVEEITRFLGSPVSPERVQDNESNVAIQNALTNENLRLKQMLDQEKLRNAELETVIRSLQAEERLRKVRPQIQSQIPAGGTARP